MFFRDILGKNSLKATLVQAIEQQQVAHAYLFHGPLGSGNLAMALATASYLNCENPKDNDACGQCSACLKNTRWVHPDVHFVFPTVINKTVKKNPTSDQFLPEWREFLTQQPYGSLADWLTFIGTEGNRQGNISVEEARSILQKISFKPYEGRYKVLILWQPESLNISAANALLKVLEEPPPQTIFLLVCNDATRLLPTIRSRVQRLGVPAFTHEEVKKYLTETTGTSTAQASVVALLANGDMAKATGLASETATDQHSYFAEWMRQCFKMSLSDLVKASDAFDAQPKVSQKNLMEYALGMFREVFLWQQGAGQLVRLSDEERGFVEKFAKAIPQKSIENITEELGSALLHLERNVRAKMVFLDLSLRLGRLFVP